MKTSTKEVLRANVLARLGKLQPLRGNETGVGRLIRLGVSNGTAQRVLDPEKDLKLETLDDLARILKVRPWQLLVPEEPQAALQDLMSDMSLSPDAESIARRLDALTSDDARRIAYALLDQVLQQAEFLERSSGGGRPKGRPPGGGSPPPDQNG